MPITVYVSIMAQESSQSADASRHVEYGISEWRTALSADKQPVYASYRGADLDAR
jgi:hypothetical protein